MLKRWHLSNFKAFQKPADLTLAPLTLFMGANSSGKSTIIQAILLIKQTLQYASTEKPLALNGPLLQLGEVRDVVSDTAQENRFSLGWTLDASGLPGTQGVGSSALAPQIGASFSEISVDLVLGPADRAPTQHQSAVEVSLRKATFRASFPDLDGQPHQSEFAISATRMPSNPNETARAGNPFAETPFYHVDSINPEAKAELLTDRPSGELAGVTLRNFFPSDYLVHYDENERRIQSIAAYLSTAAQLFRVPPAHRNTELPVSLLNQINEWFANQQQNLPYIGRPPDHPYVTSRSLRELALEIRPHLAALRGYRPGSARNSPITREFESMLDAELRRQPVPQTHGIERDTVQMADEARSIASEYFADQVRYLGPLRDEPKPIYPIQGVAALNDVGYRGEHTAAVLNANSYRVVSYLRPEMAFASEGGGVRKIETATLQRAVKEWLVYLGVAESVATSDRGKLGHELQVQSDPNGKLHDLTNVGVGVSQVLPIVVMSLIADAGSTLIFEQPELHLHPKVQTRLADFFIAMCLLGKQCILETHSEYLVHRLRLRIARDPGEEMSKLARLYFIEREDGGATCRDIVINKYGSIVDWPKDFFDQSLEEVDKILTAAASKSKRLRSKDRKGDSR